jgi:hypothetical protein
MLPAAVPYDCPISPHSIAFFHTIRPDYSLMIYYWLQTRQRSTLTLSDTATLHAIHMGRSQNLSPQPFFATVLTMIAASRRFTARPAFPFQHDKPDYRSKEYGANIITFMKVLGLFFKNVSNIPNLNVDSTSRKVYSAFNKPRLTNLKNCYYIHQIIAV